MKIALIWHDAALAYELPRNAAGCLAMTEVGGGISR
jgi:hypothetical protein